MVQKTSEKKPKRITMQYLLNNHLPIWVRNRTGDADSKHPLGLISMQVGWGDSIGRVVIPAGNDPVCITDQVDPESLKSCRDLFESVRRNGLELLDPDKAEEYYQQNEDRRQIMRDKIDSYLSGEKEDVPLPSEVLSKKTGTLHPQVGDICQRARYKAATERQTLERLIEQAKTFGEEDFRYVSINGFYDAAKRWGQAQLAALEATKKDPVEAHVSNV